MPAITADTLALPRVSAAGPIDTERPVRSITTGPRGHEGEGFPVVRAFDQEVIRAGFRPAQMTLVAPISVRLSRLRRWRSPATSSARMASPVRRISLDPSPTVNSGASR